EQADGEQVKLLNPATGPQSFRLLPETRYQFLGSGKHPDDSTAGPRWLKPGQPVSVDYVFRNHVAQAQRITIWIDRTGCTGEDRWTAATAAAGEPQSLAGTIWDSRERSGTTRFELMPGGRLTYQAENSAKQTGGAWTQNGGAVLIQV